MSQSELGMKEQHLNLPAHSFSLVNAVSRMAMSIESLFPSHDFLPRDMGDSSYHSSRLLTVHHGSSTFITIHHGSSCSIMVHHDSSASVEILLKSHHILMQFTMVHHSSSQLIRVRHGS